MLAAVLPQHTGHARKLSRPIRNIERQARHAPSARELARQHVGEKARVDVAAREHQAHLLAREAQRIGDDGREAGCACAFHDGLLDEEELVHGALEMRFAHEHDVVDVTAHDALGDIARIANGDAFGQRVAAHGKIGAAQAVVHRGVQGGLDADDLDPGLQRLGRDGHAGDEAATAHRHDQHLELGHGRPASRARPYPARR